MSESTADKTAPRGVQNIVDTTCKRISLKSVNQHGRHCSEAQTVLVFLCHRLAFVVLAFLLYYLMFPLQMSAPKSLVLSAEERNCLLEFSLV